MGRQKEREREKEMIKYRESQKEREREIGEKKFDNLRRFLVSFRCHSFEEIICTTSVHISVTIKLDYLNSAAPIKSLRHHSQVRGLWQVFVSNQRWLSLSLFVLNTCGKDLTLSVLITGVGKSLTLICPGIVSTWHLCWQSLTL